MAGRGRDLHSGDRSKNVLAKNEEGSKVNLGRQPQIAVMTKSGGLHVLPVGALKDRKEKPSHQQVLEMLKIDIDQAEAGGAIQCKENGEPDEISFQSCVINESEGNSNKGNGGQMNEENKEMFERKANEWVDTQEDGNLETEDCIWRDMFLRGEITAEQFKQGPY